MEQQVCRKCNIIKDISEFYPYYNENYSKKVRKICKKCENQRTKEYRKINPNPSNNAVRKFYKNHPEYRMRNLIKGLLKIRKYKQMLVNYAGGKCQYCGYLKCIAALDFHHLNPEDKEREIEFFSKKGREDLMKQIDNKEVILLCSNCHREDHYDSKTLELEGKV